MVMVSQLERRRKKSVVRNEKDWRSWCVKGEELTGWLIVTKATLAVGCRSDLWLYLTGTWAFMPKINRTSLFYSSNAADKMILYNCGKDNEYIYHNADKQVEFDGRVIVSVRVRGGKGGRRSSARNSRKEREVW